MNWYIPNLGYQENFLPASQYKLGHELFIITSDRIPFYKGFENNVGKILDKRILGSGECVEKNVIIYRLPTFFELKNGGIIAIFGVKSKLQEINPDIVHAHGPYNIVTLLSVFYRKKFGYKLFIDDHSNYHNYKLDSFLKKIYIVFVKIFYSFFKREVSGWMPIDEAAKQLLTKNLNICEEKIKIVSLGISPEHFFQSFDIRKSTRNELHLEDNETLIITSGKFDESKDIDILLKAFASVNKQKPNVKLLLIGNGLNSLMEYFYKIIEDANLCSSVIFLDFVKNEELYKYYNAADIGVWPGTPTITAVESLGTGLSIIIPKDDLCYKKIFEHRGAIGFTKKNIQSLSSSILYLINHRDYKEIISKNALELAKNHLVWEKIANETINFYLQ